MIFDSATITALPQEQVFHLVKEAKPTASGSKNPLSKTTSSEWLKIHRQAIKMSQIIGGDIAAAIGIHDNVVTLVTCFTNLRSAKCADFFGVISNDDLSAADISYIPKKSIGNFVLTPMLKSNAEALKLTHNDQDLSQDYNNSNNKIG